MIKQSFRATIDGQAIDIFYKYSRLSGKTELTVDGDSFTVKGKPFGIGVCRRENIMVGGAVAVLDVSKNGKAKIFLRDGDIEEVL